MSVGERPTSKVLAALESRGAAVRNAGAGWIASCPAAGHGAGNGDQRPSLSINVGDDGRALMICRAGCDTRDVLAALDLEMKDLMPDDDNRTDHKAKPSAKPDERIDREFDSAEQAIASLGQNAGQWEYVDAVGKADFYSVRINKPDGGKFFQPISRYGEKWRIAFPQGHRLLYGLPNLSGAETVLLVEGEKCADAAMSLGFVATTTAGGSSQASKTDLTPLAGRELIILPDNDEAGSRYVESLRKQLESLKPAPTVHVVNLPGLPAKGDIVDWIEQHDAKTTEELGVACQSDRSCKAQRSPCTRANHGSRIGDWRLQRTVRGSWNDR